MLRVLMMGGRRCGKTSALTSMFYQAINGDLNEIFTLNNATTHQQKDKEVIDLLENKRLELQNFIAKGKNRIFLADQNPTMNFWDYTLRLQIPGTGRDMEVVFRDSAGEVFDPANQHYTDTMNYVKECDVFIVVVDTPYLMAGTDVEKEAANIKDSIHTFLTNMNRDKAVQVIFVPVKCEKWIKEGKIDSVKTAVKLLYRATINDLLATEKIEVSIIPIQTAGDIVFEELRNPYLLYNNITKKEQKCSKDKNDDTIVITSDGKPHQLRDGECVNEDPNGTFPGTSIVRPSAWYSLWHSPKAAYSPYNCEQIVIHIIRFMFNKTKAEAPEGFFGRLLSIIFGTIRAEEMEDALGKLSKLGRIKDSGDGIEILKSCFKQTK